MREFPRGASAAAGLPAAHRRGSHSVLLQSQERHRLCYLHEDESDHTLFLYSAVEMFGLNIKKSGIDVWMAHVYPAR